MEPTIQTVEVDGITVEIDVTFLRSWRGIRMASDMRSPKLSDEDRFLATVEYYELVCPNIDEVDTALHAAHGDEEVTANDVMAFVAGAAKRMGGEAKN